MVPAPPSRDQTAPIVADAGLEGDYLEATKVPPKGFDTKQYGATSDGRLTPARSAPPRGVRTG